MPDSMDRNLPPVRQSMIRHVVILAICCVIVTAIQWLLSHAFGFDPFSGKGDANRFMVSSAAFLLFFLPGSALLNGKWMTEVITPAHWVVGAITWGVALYGVFQLLTFVDRQLRRPKSK